MSKTPLHVAAESGEAETALAHIQSGASVDAIDEDRRTPLHLAAMEGHARVVRAIIEAGASVDAKDLDDGMTPLHLAAMVGHTQVVRALVEAGASVDGRDLSGTTALHFAAMEGKTETALALATSGASLEATDVDSRTPLYFATVDGAVGTVLALAEAGASVDAKTNDDVANCDKPTALQHAVENGNVAMALANLEAKDRNGWTLLHFQAFKRETAMFLALARAGASLEATSNAGKTPLDVAPTQSPQCETNLKFLRFPVKLATV